MRDWSRAIDRPHAFERHREPLPVALLPIERSPPDFPIDDRPAVSKPERVGSIAAVLDECEPFRIGDKAVGETERMDQLAVARRLIVPREAFAAVTYIVDPAGIFDPAMRLRFTLIRARAWRQVGRPQRICGEKRENVGQHQLLMLLFVIDADLDNVRQLGSRGHIARKKLFEPGVHMGAVGEDAIARRPREESALAARLPRPMRFVIGIEAIVESLVERLKAVEMAGENEALEEPSRMRKMPFGRTGVVHRLDGHILGA
jgi:hypothetical protein